MVDPNQIINILFGAGTTATAAWFAFKRFKDRYIAGAKSEENEIQKKIDAAVAQEKERIDRVREIADEWKELAEQRKVKLEEMREHISKVEESLRQLRVEHTELIKANTELILRVQRLESKTLDKGE